MDKKMHAKPVPYSSGGGPSVSRRSTMPRFDYSAYSGRASALATDIVDRHASDLEPAIAEALCYFAEMAVQQDRKRTARDQPRTTPPPPMNWPYVLRYPIWESSASKKLQRSLAELDAWRTAIRWYFGPAVEKQIDAYASGELEKRR